MPPTIVFAGGGSGGHLYPALAVARELRAQLGAVRIVFLGTNRPIEHRILDETDCEFLAQDLPGLSAAPWRWPGLLLAYRRSAARCRDYFSAAEPGVVVGTGGLASVPAIREAHALKIPTALLNPDALPGRANRHLRSLVDAVFVQWDDARQHFSGCRRVEVAGCPVRSGFNEADRGAGITRFGLNPELRTLLVTGASQGSRSVNEAVVAVAERVLAVGGWQILHCTGSADYETVRGAYESRSLPAVVVDYTDHMSDALAAADLVVSRAGASTLAELTAVGRASILMPYPHHRDEHQTANARCLVKVGAARIVKDEVDASTNEAALWSALEPLLSSTEMRESMATAARSIGRGNAASRVAELLVELIDARHTAYARESVEAAIG